MPADSGRYPSDPTATPVRSPSRAPLSLRLTQAALLLAAGGAVAIMLGFGSTVSLVGLAGVVTGTVLTAPSGRGPGGGWWSLLGAGALLSIAGALLSLASAAAGGLIALLGGIAVVTGAALGFPLAERRGDG